MVLESYAVRARWVRERKFGPEGKRQHPLRFLESAYPDLPEHREILEVFVVRDVIAHNHLWEATVSAERGRWLELIRRARDPQAGDWKYEQTVDPDSVTTKILGLNVFPTKLDRFDVAKVLGVVTRTLRFIDTRESGRLGIVGLRGDFFGEEDLDLWQIAERISASL